LRPDTPSDLERVVLWCLAKKPVERPADIDALEQALGQCVCAADWDKHRASAWWHDSCEASGTEIRGEPCSR